MTLPQIVTAGHKLESELPVEAIRLYLAKRLDVYWGIVKQV